VIKCLQHFLLPKHPTERFTDDWLAKFSDGGLILGSSSFSILPQLPPKILLNSKVVDQIRFIELTVI